MIFHPELAALVLEGSKTVTRRPVKDGKPCRYRVGSAYSVQLPIEDGPGKGRGGKAIAYIQVTSVDRIRLGAILDSYPEARREGFVSPRHFFDYWCRLYDGSFDPGQWVDRIKFSVISPEDYRLWPNCPRAAGGSR